MRPLLLICAVLFSFQLKAQTKTDSINSAFFDAKYKAYLSESSDTLFVESTLASNNYWVFDSQNHSLLNGKLLKGLNIINITKLSNGTYTLSVADNRNLARKRITISR